MVQLLRVCLYTVPLYTPRRYRVKIVRGSWYAYQCAICHIRSVPATARQYECRNEDDDGMLPMVLLSDNVVIATSLFPRLATLNNQLVELEELADDRLSLQYSHQHVF
jgi:hypothetical protein